MAIVRAVKSGNWSDPTVWNTGSLPTTSDDVYSNTFTVTIDVSPTVLSISNAEATEVTAGGSFVPSNGITLTCTGAGVVGGTASCFVSSLTTGQSCTVVANCIGGSAIRAYAINNSSTGTINIVGNCTAGTASATFGVNNSSAGTVNITGNCSASSVSNTYGANNNSTGTMNITGNCVGGSAVSNSLGAQNLSSGVINITGTCSGGSGVGGYGVVNNSGTLTHVGAVQAGSGAAGIGAGNASQITILTGPLISSDGSGGAAAASGVNPCVALRWFPADTALSTFEYRVRGATISGSPSTRPQRQLFLTDAYSSTYTYPAVSNVRLGTSYSPGNSLTGTCAIPAPSSVVAGVPVDNTIGTAFLDPKDIWNVPVSEVNTSGSIGQRLKNSATVDSTGAQISSFGSS